MNKKVECQDQLRLPMQRSREVRPPELTRTLVAALADLLIVVAMHREACNEQQDYR